MRLGSRTRTVAVGAAAIVTVTVAPAGRATPSFSFTRLAGADRYATAATVAVDTYGTSPTAVLTTGERFPDALAGAFVAGLSRSPILLTRRDALPAPTIEALDTLRTARVVIVGGTDAVTTDVESELQRRAILTERVAGADRYGTAAEAATMTGPAGVGLVNGSRTAIVASGENFPDALAGGPLAYAGRHPILLTPRSSLAEVTRQALASLGVQQVVLPGGVAAVSAEVQRAIEAMGISVVRFAGADRTDTAVQLADWAIANAGFSRTHANLARGDDFADALSGGPHGGSDGPAAIVLTQTSRVLGATTRAWFAAHAPTLEGGHLFGGTAAVSSNAEDEAVAAARSASPGPTTTVVTPSPYFTGAQASASASTITVTYNEPVACESVDADGSGYVVTIRTGPGSPANALPTAAACDAPMLGTSDTVEITLPPGVLRAKQTGRVDVKDGTDGDTVRTPLGQEQVDGNWVPFTVQ